MGRKRKIQDLELAYLYGLGMTNQEIADKIGVTQPAVSNALKKLRKESPELLEEQGTELFRAGESDRLAEMRKIILGSIRRKLSTMSLGTVSLQQLATLYGVLFDKDRLLRGESTEHIATASYTQLDDKTKSVISNAVKELTSQMLEVASSKSNLPDPTPEVEMAGPPTLD